MTTLAIIKESLNDFKPNSTGHEEFNSVLTLFVEAEPQLINAELISGLKEDVLVEMQFKPDILQGPFTLYRILRDYLVLKGFE